MVQEVSISNFCYLPNHLLLDMVSIPLFFPGTFRGLIANIPVSASSGWNAQNLASVSAGYGSSGCSGFTVQQFANINWNAYRGWTILCVGDLNLDIIKAVNVTQMKYPVDEKCFHSDPMSCC